MRYRLAIAAAALWAGTACADEPAACYVANDPTGEFASGKAQLFTADPGIATQVEDMMQETSRATGKCVQRFLQREGGRVSGGAALLYGARISPAGKVTQVSVLKVLNINDAMLMACIGRTICKWELKPGEDGQERLVILPPHAISGHVKLRINH